MEEVIHDGLNVINGGGQNELEDPKSVNAGKSPKSIIKYTNTNIHSHIAGKLLH